MTDSSDLILQSLVDGPLLVGDLPEAACFPLRRLSSSGAGQALNLDQKLGHLCEDALALLIGASTGFDLVARNLPLRRNAHSTVGEIDFLVRDHRDGQLIHLELAIKFYLAVASEGGLLLPGPDARDNYFRKIQRLRSHQLPLIQRHRDLLPDAWRDETIRNHQLVYGCLFDSVHSCEPAKPEFINLDCRRGRWLPIHEISTHFPQGTVFRLIPKPLWPVPLESIADAPLERWKPEPSIDRCVMIQVNDETEPYFVVPAGYPDSVGMI